MKSYRALRSSAPAHSILNAQAFRYTNSADTDIRRTFARLRRAGTSQHLQPSSAPNVLPLILKWR